MCGSSQWGAALMLPLRWRRNWEVENTNNHVQSGVVNVADWEDLQTTGNIVNVGSVVDAASSDIMSFTPTAITVGGITCKLVPAPSMPS